MAIPTYEECMLPLMKIAEDGKEPLFRAKKYVTDIDAKIILLDGKQLTELMIENNLGVSTQDVYTIKRIDSDYFEEN